MVHLAAKALLQAQLRWGDQGMHDLFIDPVGRIGHQDAQRLGGELPVEIQAVDDTGGVVRVALIAVKGMCLLGLGVIGGPRGSLHLAAVPAERKPRARAFRLATLKSAPGFPSSPKFTSRKVALAMNSKPNGRSWPSAARLPGHPSPRNHREAGR